MLSDAVAWNGMPPEPERVQRAWLERYGNEIVIAKWGPDDEPCCWYFEDFGDLEAETVATFCRYLGPCLTPAEVAAREAAAWVAGRDAAEKAAEDHGDKAASAIEPSNGMAYYANGAAGAASVIRALPPPSGASALTEALAAAREAEREACVDASGAVLRRLADGLVQQSAATSFRDDMVKVLLSIAGEIARAIRAPKDKPDAE